MNNEVISALSARLQNKMKQKYSIHSKTTQSSLKNVKNKIPQKSSPIVIIKKRRSITMHDPTYIQTQINPLYNLATKNSINDERAQNMFQKTSHAFHNFQFQKIFQKDNNQQILQKDAHIGLMGIDILKQQQRRETQQMKGNLAYFFKKFQKDVESIRFEVFMQKDIKETQISFITLKELQKDYYNTDIRENLSSLSFFQNMDFQKMNQILDQCTLCKFQKRKQVNIDQNFYIIISGSVCQYSRKLERGIQKNIILKTFSDGEFFGDFNAIQNHFNIKIEIQEQFNESYDKQIYNLSHRKQDDAFISQEESYLLQIPIQSFINNYFSAVQEKITKEVHFLESIDLFHCIPQRVLFKYEPNIPKKIFKMGEIIINNGDNLNNLCIITKGCARIIYYPQGVYKTQQKNMLSYQEEFLIKTISVGDYFGQRCVLTGHQKEIKKKELAIQFEKANLIIVADTPTTEMLCISPQKFIELDDMPILMTIQKRIIQSKEFDDLDFQVHFLQRLQIKNINLGQIIK